MFAADLSWHGEAAAESVGQRRERKARERSSGTPSIRTSVTSKSSSSTDRQQWWTSGLKKVRAKASSKSSVEARPVTRQSSSSQQKTDSPLQPVRESGIKDFPTRELELPHHLRDPAPQPTYTFSKSLSPNLPSGASMDLLEYDVPELEGDVSSRYTQSIVSIASRMLKMSRVRY